MNRDEWVDCRLAGEQLSLKDLSAEKGRKIRDTPEAGGGLAARSVTMPEHESELERALRAARTPFTRGNAVEIHRVGSTGLDAMLAAVSGARRSIDLETYILRADATGRRFFRALAERARNGANPSPP